MKRTIIALCLLVLCGTGCSSRWRRVDAQDRMARGLETQTTELHELNITMRRVATALEVQNAGE